MSGHGSIPGSGRIALARRLRLAEHLSGFPARLGYWPAVIQFAGFAWFELIDPAPDDPARLAAVGSRLYGAFNLAATLIFGHRDWSRRGEFLSVFFGMVSAFAILQERRGEQGRAAISLGLPGAKLADASPLPPSGVAFLLLALASVSFDGLSRTFFWLGLNGVNPLEFPGRTAMVGDQHAGLAAAFLALAAVFFLAVADRRKADIGKTRPLAEAAGLYVWSIVPIALAYHFAHYLTVLLVNGQYAIVALSDPYRAGLEPVRHGLHGRQRRHRQRLGRGMGAVECAGGCDRRRSRAGGAGRAYAGRPPASERQGRHAQPIAADDPDDRLHRAGPVAAVDADGWMSGRNALLQLLPAPGIDDLVCIHTSDFPPSGRRGRRWFSRSANAQKKGNRHD